MTQPNVPDRPQDGEARPAAVPPPGPERQADPASPPVGHPAASSAGHPASPPIRPPASPPIRPPGGSRRPGAARRPVAPGPASATPSSERALTRRSVTARLALVIPLAMGVLSVEGMFAARGESGDIISLPAAGAALLLIWVGVAWALHSWVALLMTFVPAVMITLGAAMIGNLAAGAGSALLLVGTALLAAIASFRLSAPARGWTPGWTAGPRTVTGPWPSVGSWFPADSGTTSPPARGIGHADGPGGNGRPASAVGAGDGTVGGDGAAAAWFRTMFRPLDPLGAHFLHPRSTEPSTGAPPPGSTPGSTPGGTRDDPSPATDPDRPAPAWDTSATNRAARDDLVALLCRRGGAAGPTLATLEEFFTGNGDPRSIAPGLRGTVPLATVRAVLHRVREHRAVAELLVQVEPLEAGRYPAGEWPVAGSLHVIATLDADELDAMLAPVHPEPVIGPLPAAELTSGGPAPEGSGEFAVWWS